MSATTSAFLSTLNSLSNLSATPPADPERAQRLVLERLQHGPADEHALSDLPLPMSVTMGAVQYLIGLGLVEREDNHLRLSRYAGKALTYLTLS